MTGSAGAGARLIIFDLTFDPERDGDGEFAAALERHRDRVVIGADIELGANTVSEDPPIIFVPPNKQLIPDGFLDDRVGDAGHRPDTDNRIRRINYAITDSQIIKLMRDRYRDPGPAQPGETIYESLDGRAVRKLGFANRLPPAGHSSMIRFGPDEAYPALFLIRNLRSRDVAV